MTHPPHRRGGKIIYDAYNFLPETGLERELGIEHTLEHRIVEIHRTIGEDAAILHKSEQINKEDMYAIYRGDASVLEDEPAADIFNLLEAEEIMRQLQRTDPDRFREIVTLPDGVRSARRAIGHPGLFVFCQAGNYQRLYLVDRQGHRTADPQQAIRAIRCEEDEPTLALPDNVNERIATVKRDFDAEVRAREAEVRNPAGSALGRDYVLTELRLVFQAERDADEKARLVLLSEIFTAAPLVERRLPVPIVNSIRCAGARSPARRWSRNSYASSAITTWRRPTAPLPIEMTKQY